MLHHSDDPVHTLKEAHRVTKAGGRVIVIESVFGPDARVLDKSQRLDAKEYLGLNASEQRLANVFFDHFYNRVIHYSENPQEKVNVPYHFNTPAAWKQLFEKNGFRQIHVQHLGVDQPAVPEYHTLHVLEVLKPMRQKNVYSRPRK